MTDYIYRVVRDNGPDAPLLDSKIRVYAKPGTAKGVKTQLNNEAEYYGLHARYKVQRAKVEWEDFE